MFEPLRSLPHWARREAEGFLMHAYTSAGLVRVIRSSKNKKTRPVWYSGPFV